MSQRPKNPQLGNLVVKLLIVFTLIVWLSSCIQLSLFNGILSSKMFLLIGYSWLGGVGIDLLSVLCFTLPNLLTGKTASPLTISLFFYLASSILYGKPSIFLSPEPSIFFQSAVKVVEFWLLMLFHILCSIALPNWIDEYNERRN